MTIQQKIKMSPRDLLGWAAAQPSGRFELVDGEPVRMAAERAVHNKVKARTSPSILKDSRSPWPTWGHATSAFGFE